MNDGGPITARGKSVTELMSCSGWEHQLAPWAGSLAILHARLEAQVGMLCRSGSKGWHAAARLTLMTLALVALGCTAPVVVPAGGPASGTPRSTATDIPTPFSTLPATPAATELVVRMIVDEFPTPDTLQEPPEFSLYADGHVIYVEEGAPDGNWRLRHARLDTSAMEGLVEQAVAGLRDARESYDDVVAAEVSRHDPWTRFDVRTPELRKSVSVYALGERDDDAPSRAVRARLNPLRERLLDFRREVDAGNALDLGEYAPAAFLVELVDAPDELAGEIHWPWPTLGVDDFAQTDRGVFARVMSAVELNRVLPFADGAFLITTSPSGHRYVMYLTPLLPGEPTL